MPQYGDRYDRYSDRYDRYDDRYDRYDERYDQYDRYGDNTKLYVGRLSTRTRTQDVEYLFGRYGRVRNVELKHDYGFVEFSDPRDADDARYELDGRDFGGSRIIVEFAKGTPRGPGGSVNYVSRSLPPGAGRCFNCGIEGHWARDCKAGNWKNKCYRCGQMGHIEKNCQNSPKNLKRGGRYSRSPSPQRGRSRSRSYSRGHKGYSESPSPRRDVLEEMPSPGRDDHGAGRKERRPRSSSYSPRRSASPSCYNRSPTSNGMSHPPRKQAEGNGAHHSARGDSQSPTHYRRPTTNGRSPSP